MPISYELDRGASLVRFRSAGQISLREMLDSLRQLKDESAAGERLDVLADMSDLQSLPETAELSSVAHEIEAMANDVQWGACAVVAPHDALFGISRVFEALASEHFSDFGVFRELAEAERWLASVPSLSA